jgi:hypothetical protein
MDRTKKGGISGAQRDPLSFRIGSDFPAAPGRLENTFKGVPGRQK